MRQRKTLITRSKTRNRSNSAIFSRASWPDSIPSTQSFRPSRAGLLLWRRLQGFAKGAHPWLISSHPFAVEEFRPIGGAEYVIERGGHFKFQIRKGAALCHGDREGKRRLK